MALALTNGRIYTVDPVRPWAEAVLIEDRAFTRVGTDEDIRAAAPPGTEFIDLRGRMAMPGLHDAHTHLLFSGLTFKHEVRLTPGAGPNQIVHDLSGCKCADLVAEGEQAWIVGGEFLPMAFGDGDLDRRFFDELFPDQPVFLYDYTIHHALVNSKALELAGLDENSQDPPGGRLVRREGSRELTGELVEQARWPVLSAMPDYRAEVYREALLWAVSVCHQFGITSIQEASASPQALAAYRDIDLQDGLDLHAAAHMVWREEGFGMASTAELDRTIASHEQFATEHLDPRFVKIWLDGAPLPPHMTQADLDDDGGIDRSNILVDPEQLAEVVGQFDAAGLGVKIHCAGEGSVRAAFDAFQAVRAANGPDGPRHEVAHCTYIHANGYHRSRDHTVVAEMSPAIWHIEDVWLGGRLQVQDDSRGRRHHDRGIGLDHHFGSEPLPGRPRNARARQRSRRPCDGHRDVDHWRCSRRWAWWRPRVYLGRKVRRSHRARQEPVRGPDRTSRRHRGASDHLRGEDRLQGGVTR